MNIDKVFVSSVLTALAPHDAPLLLIRDWIEKLPSKTLFIKANHHWYMCSEKDDSGTYHCHNYYHPSNIDTLHRTCKELIEDIQERRINSNLWCTGLIVDDLRIFVMPIVEYGHPFIPEFIKTFDSSLLALQD